MGKYEAYLAALDNLDAPLTEHVDALNAAVSEDVSAIQAGADATIATQAAELEAARLEITRLQAHNYQLLTAPTTPADNGDGGTDDEEDPDDEEYPEDAFENENEE